MRIWKRSIAAALVAAGTCGVASASERHFSNSSSQDAFNQVKVEWLSSDSDGASPELSSSFLHDGKSIAKIVSIGEDAAAGGEHENVIVFQFSTLQKKHSKIKGFIKGIARGTALDIQTEDSQPALAVSEDLLLHGAASDIQPDDVHSDVTATPEPATLALSGIGALSLGLYAWRRRHVSALAV